MSGYGIAFALLVPAPLFWTLTAAAVALIGLAAARRAPGTPWRAVGAAALLLALANPTLVRETRAPLADIALLLVDDSASQAIGRRPAQTEAAVRHIRDRAATLEGLDLRIVRAGADATAGGTRLFEALRGALADVSAARIGAAILVTDGRVHDAPGSDWRPARDGLAGIGPVHVLLTGARDEADRRLVIDHAPRFGLVGDSVRAALTVLDETAPPGGRARLTLRRDGTEIQRLEVPVNVRTELALAMPHAGETVFQIETAPGARELTLDNNQALLSVNGVRDRLRVLLVSGQPHAGERAWRNLLKSDPAVDLVHFTILRPPDKQDSTPLHQLALIPFPIRELFEVKLDGFDLVIFDRYRRRGFLPQLYLSNVADYARAGGAVLVAAGPDFATPASLAGTPLGDVLPGAPTGRVLERPFRPRITTIGARHPVTADLAGSDGGTTPSWGRWFRQIDIQSPRGRALLGGVEDRPLLLLDRVGKGRVALLLSDQTWLWARNFEGGGPHAELARRLAHWLMKEPDLEEDELRARHEGGVLTVTRRSLDETDAPVRVSTPAGDSLTLPLEPVGPGRAQGRIALTAPGLYRLDDGARQALAPVAGVNPLETADLRATENALAPLAAATGGATLWLGESGLPDLRRPRAGRDMAGVAGPARSPWIGIRAESAHRVTGLDRLPLLPALLLLLAALAPLLLAWHREGR